MCSSLKRPVVAVLVANKMAESAQQLPSTMRAAWYEATGDAKSVLQYGEHSLPDMSDQQVLVRLHATGVNPSDVKTRAGGRGMAFPKIIPHSDGAGIVVATGDSCDPSLIGQRVYVRNGQWGRHSGTAAEYIAIEPEFLHALPDEVSFEVGAALGIPALTAAYAVFKDGPVDGVRLLIHGGGGTVARLAVQLAVDAGAHVIATTSSDPTDLQNLGCAGVIDYRTADMVTAAIKANDGLPFDRIIDAECGLNFAANAELIAPKGVIVGYGSALSPTPEMPFMPLMFKNVTLSLILVYLLGAEEAQAYADIVADMLCEGRLDVPIAATLPLEEIATAHQMVEEGKRHGAVILQLPPA